MSPRLRGPLKHVAVGPLPPERFKGVLTAEAALRLDETIAEARLVLDGRAVWSANSTARGGGVAELLSAMIAYTRGAGIDARWVVLRGEPDFFALTKHLHNLLHGVGDGGPPDRDGAEVFEQVSQEAAGALLELVRPGDIVLAHDPQTAGLCAPLREAGVRVVWRCHVGMDVPNDAARAAWSFLLPYVQSAEAFVFSREVFVPPEIDPGKVTIIPPSIDAFSPKNQAMADDAVSAILCRVGVERCVSGTPAFYARHDGTRARVDRHAELHGTEPIAPDVPVVTQVSRWDRLKDHAGVMKAFAGRIGPDSDAHLLLAGPSPDSIADDPEGLEVFDELIAQWRSLPDAYRRRVHIASLPMVDPEENAAIVNAVQRRSDVVVQKSLAEGFGLTVAEAMWKDRPVVASAVGGIQDQIEDGVTGLLVEPRDLEAFAEAVLRLLRDRDEAERIGQRAGESVREAFLGPRLLSQYVELFAKLLQHEAEPLPT